MIGTSSKKQSGIEDRETYHSRLDGDARLVEAEIAGGGTPTDEGRDRGVNKSSSTLRSRIGKSRRPS
jgi:hypothetical protein